MAVLYKTATTVKQMFQAISMFLIDSTQFTSGNAWQLIRPAKITTDTTEIILKGIGEDGTEAIYIGLKILSTGNTQQDIIFNGFAGYDENLNWWEQPGCIPLKTVKISANGKQIPDYTGLPCIPLAKDTKLTYWVTANSSRISIRVKMSYQYEAAYLGFFKPVSIKRQYPYPLAIGGSSIYGNQWNSHANVHSIFLNPCLETNRSSLCIRLPDGTWECAGNTNKKNISHQNISIWPTDIQPVDTFTIPSGSDDINVLEDNLLFPIMLYQCNPHNILGQFDGVFWVGNKVDLAAEDNTLYLDKTYKIFNNVYGRDNDSYHALEWV